MPHHAGEHAAHNQQSTGVPNSGKRIVDVIVAFVLLIVLALPLVVLAAVVALHFREPPFFSQSRVGHLQRPFIIRKFRSMRSGPTTVRPSDGAAVSFLYMPREDPRVTPLGHVLRRFSVDELPQLLNVLIGDMSLVGPRPFDVRDFDEGPVRDPLFAEWMRGRHLVRPGMTGLWQVSGRSGTSFQELIELDLRYVRQWTLRMELSILRRTFRAVLGGSGTA